MGPLSHTANQNPNCYCTDNITHFCDAHQREALLSKIVDRVWLNREDFTMTHQMKKLNHKWLSLYPIRRVISRSAYWLKLPSSFSHIPPIFLVTLLRPYNADVITKCVQHDPPPPVICDGVKEYEVECILDSQVFRAKLEYLVCWKGTAMRRMSGDQQRVSKAPENWYLNSTGGTLKHFNTYLPSTLSISPSVLTKFTDTPYPDPADWATG